MMCVCEERRIREGQCNFNVPIEHRYAPAGTLTSKEDLVIPMHADAHRLKSITGMKGVKWTPELVVVKHPGLKAPRRQKRPLWRAGVLH